MEKEQYLLRQFPPPPESPQPPKTPARRFRLPWFSPDRLPFRETQLSISFEGLDVRMVAVRGDQVVGWHETTLPSRLIRNGFLVAGAEAGQHIRSFLNRNNLSPGHLQVALPGLHSIIRVVPVPTTIHINNSLVEREARHLLGGSLDSAYVFWQTLPTRRQNPVRQVYMVVVPREPLTNAVESLTFAGLKVSSVDLKPLAVARAVNARDGIIGHADLHGGDVVVVVGGVPTHIHSFYWGDEPLAVEYAHMRLVNELAQTISSYNDTHRGQPLDPNVPVCLTGLLAEDEALATTVTNMTGRQVAEPLPPLRYPSNFHLRTFMVPLGMVLKRK